MATISKQLLKSELDQWNTMHTVSGECLKPRFGQYMNKKYHFQDDILDSITDVKEAHARIKKKHVQKI